VVAVEGDDVPLVAVQRVDVHHVPQRPALHRAVVGPREQLVRAVAERQALKTINQTQVKPSHIQSTHRFLNWTLKLNVKRKLTHSTSF
jgi:hypothetical protein